MTKRLNFRFIARLSRRYRGFRVISPLTYAQPALLATSPTRVVNKLHVMNLHWPIIITWSPQFTLGFSPYLVLYLNLDKFIICIYHSSVIHSSFTVKCILIIIEYSNLCLLWVLKVISCFLHTINNYVINIFMTQGSSASNLLSLSLFYLSQVKP